MPDEKADLGERAKRRGRMLLWSWWIGSGSEMERAYGLGLDWGWEGRSPTRISREQKEERRRCR